MLQAFVRRLLVRNNSVRVVGRFNRSNPAISRRSALRRGRSVLHRIRTRSGPAHSLGLEPQANPRGNKRRVLAEAVLRSTPRCHCRRRDLSGALVRVAAVVQVWCEQGDDIGLVGVEGLVQPRNHKGVEPCGESLRRNLKVQHFSFDLRTHNGVGVNLRLAVDAQPEVQRPRSVIHQKPLVGVRRKYRADDRQIVNLVLRCLSRYSRCATVDRYLVFAVPVGRCSCPSISLVE